MENYTKNYSMLLYAKKAKLVIEEKAVVGVCALVNKSVSDGATVVGIPRRVIQTVKK